MSAKIDAARLRGSLPLAVDARIVESAARSDCERYRSIAAVGVDPTKIARVAYGSDAPVSDSLELSPFARAIGVAFERWLLDHDASALCDAYEAAHGTRPTEVADLRPLHAQGHHDEAVARTSELVRRRLEDGTGPDVILGARLLLQTPAGEEAIHPDVLYAQPGWRQFRVDDIKAYLDLDGRTDPTEIATAVRQCAVGMIALRQAFGAGATLDEAGLVLRIPRRPGAGVRLLDATVEIATIGVWLARSAEMAVGASALTGGAPIASAESLERIPHRWERGCEHRCSLSEICHGEALRTDSIDLLGPTAADAIDGVASLGRAKELATGDSPSTADERRVAASLAAGWRAAEELEAQLAAL